MNNDDTQTDLRRFHDNLTIGNPALSLRNRQAFALAEYMPLAERMRSGEIVAVDDFKQKAEALLAIERQIYGSQAGYFDRLGEITSLINAAIALLDEPVTQETKVSDWLTQQFQDTTTDNDPKPAYLKRAKDLFPNLSDRGFNQIWNNVAPRFGKNKAGAKRKN